MNIKSIEATVGVISIIFGVYVFLFADAWIGWKIGLLVFVSATIAIRILWSRINKKILIQLPIILKKRSDLSQAPKNMIQYYGSRSELPFEQILSNAHKIDMVAVTFSDLTVHNMGSIIGAVKRGVQFTFLILDPSSHHKQTLEIYHAADDIDYQITKSIQRLTDERKKLELGLQDNLIIRKYDFIAPHSIIIRDRYDDQAWIRIEDRPLGSVSNDIPSYSKYKKEDETFFQKYSKEYDIIYNHSILLNINS